MTVELTEHVPFFEMSPTAMVVAAADGTLAYLNPRAAALFGVARDEVLGKPTTQWWVDPDGQSKFVRALAEEGRVIDFELALRRRDGSVFWSIVSAFTASWNGEPARCSTFQDVTRAKRAEVRAVENERKYRLLAEHADDVIWTVDARSGKFTYISPSIERLRGLTVEEALAESVELSLTPESFTRAQARMTAAMTLPAEAVPRVTSDVYDQPCRDGSIKHVEIKVNTVRDPAGSPLTFVGVSRDVTARVHAEAAQAHLLSELRRALEEVKTLSGLVPICAHCKSVRDDEGYWHEVERWVSEHSEARFSHGICPSCLAEHFPED